MSRSSDTVILGFLCPPGMWFSDLRPAASPHPCRKLASLTLPSSLLRNQQQFSRGLRPGHLSGTSHIRVGKRASHLSCMHLEEEIEGKLTTSAVAKRSSNSHKIRLRYLVHFGSVCLFGTKRESKFSSSENGKKACRRRANQQKRDAVSWPVVDSLPTMFLQAPDTPHFQRLAECGI